MRVQKIRVAAAALALALTVMSCPIAMAATDVKTYQTVAYAQANEQPAGQKIAIDGKPNYTAVTTTKEGNLYGFDTADGVYYIQIGKTTVAAMQAAAPSQQMTLYGTYSGKLAGNGMPILDIQSGAVMIGDKLNEFADLSAAGQKALAAASSSAQTAAAPAAPTTSEKVWIPTNGGKKYHSKSSCSGMKDPKEVDLAQAEAEGYTPCKKCH